jgi:hypothetical protein
MDIEKFMADPKPAFDNNFWRIEASNDVQSYDELHHGIDEVWEDAHRLEQKGYAVTLIQKD